MSDIQLQDKYNLEKTKVLLSGTQALVRLLLEQKQLDESAGYKTAGFVSGYRGSPLGGLDMELADAGVALASHEIVFEPGLNEDLAATAVWGTQQIAQLPAPKYEGVFSLWYGKGPGVDRAGDPMKHGNYYGVTKTGGVLVVFGDDHAGKSSTVCHQSEQALSANSIPVLYPATAQELVEYGLLGWAMSRYCGLWVGLKCINETVETTSTMHFDRANWSFLAPPSDLFPPEGVHARGVFSTQLDEMLVTRHKLPLAQAFARANRIDRTMVGDRNAKLGIVASGKGYADALDALKMLSIDNARAQTLGIAIYKVGLIWPLEPDGLREFTARKEELLFIEEKKAFIEDQAKKILFNEMTRPRIVGKTDENGLPLIDPDIQLSPLKIALVIAGRLRALGIIDAELERAVRMIESRGKTIAPIAGLIPRSPYFCSGCPHNRSTKVPEGSHGLAGIGCHGMVMWMNRNTLPPCQMGGEGANWIGISPFSGTSHVFQNLGDGTYTHSGLLAIRAAVSAGVNITYKILYNDAVAMTGGQPVEGSPSVEAIAGQVLAEGVKTCVVVTDDVEKYENIAISPEVTIRPRSELEDVQTNLRAKKGVTAIIYEQTCAAEKRRRRKQGTYPDPQRRLFINSAVCEGCGDCSVQSNCVSILPLETDFGRKRKIDQSSCNKDYSCVEGFCPSFVGVKGGAIRKMAATAIPDELVRGLPNFHTPEIGHGYNVIIAGIGGSGVVTLGSILAMAANIQDLGCVTYNVTGLAQKGGAVFSHVKFTKTPHELVSSKVAAADADLVIAADAAAATAAECLGAIAQHRTLAVVNTYLAPLAQFQASRDLIMESDTYVGAIKERAGTDDVMTVDATGIAREVLGDAIAGNMFLIGFAFQKGLLPLAISAIEKAIELNGVAVAFNKQALILGRLAAHDMRSVHRLLNIQSDVSPAPVSLPQLIEAKKAFLRAYQNESLACRYEALVQKAQATEQRLGASSNHLTRAVATNFAKLLAYKDEYEVARLYGDSSFKSALQNQFQGDYKLSVHLAPPLFARRDPTTNLPRKTEFGPWMFRAFTLLAKLKFLRGTLFDVFGYTHERRQERALAENYEATLTAILGKLTVSSLPVATELAALPDSIRGFGHVKARAIQLAAERQAALLKQLNMAD